MSKIRRLLSNLTSMTQDTGKRIRHTSQCLGKMESRSGRYRMCMGLLGFPSRYHAESMAALNSWVCTVFRKSKIFGNGCCWEMISTKKQGTWVSGIPRYGWRRQSGGVAAVWHPDVLEAAVVAHLEVAHQEVALVVEAPLSRR